MRQITTVVARLDLTDEGQRRLHDFILRMHTGRWPTLRALAMRQGADGRLYEAAEWLRTVERYSLIEWRADGNGMRIQPMLSRSAALSALRSAC